MLEFSSVSHMNNSWKENEELSCPHLSRLRSAHCGGQNNSVNWSRNIPLLIEKKHPVKMTCASKSMVIHVILLQYFLHNSYEEVKLPTIYSSIQSKLMWSFSEELWICRAVETQDLWHSKHTWLDWTFTNDGKHSFTQPIAVRWVRTHVSDWRRSAL